MFSRPWSRHSCPHPRRARARRCRRGTSPGCRSRWAASSGPGQGTRSRTGTRGSPHIGPDIMMTSWWWSLWAHDSHAHLTLAYWQVSQWVNHVLIHDDVTSLVLDIVTEVCCCGCCCSGGGSCWRRGRPVTWWPCVWRRRGTSHATLERGLIDRIWRYLLPHNLHNIHRN